MLQQHVCAHSKFIGTALSINGHFNMPHMAYTSNSPCVCAVIGSDIVSNRGRNSRRVSCIID